MTLFTQSHASSKFSLINDDKLSQT